MMTKKLFIDGAWVDGSEGKTFKSINPATGEVIAEVAEATVDDARRAIAAAKKSFYETREWRDMDSQARGDMLLKIADAIEENLQPKGVMVMLEAEHMCMTMRGAKKPGTITSTIVTRGVFETDYSLQQTFLQMVRS